MADNKSGSKTLAFSSSLIYENVDIENPDLVGEFCVIGKPCRDKTRSGGLITTLGKGTELGAYCVLYEGCRIGSNCLIRDYCSIGEESILGNKVKLQYRSQVNKRVSIGDGSRVGGFCCNDSVIGSHCTMYGALVHHYPKHGGSNEEKAPTLESNVIIAFGAIVAGNILVGRNSYIGAGAIVTKDIPEDSIVIGANKIIPRKSGKGTLQFSEVCDY